jgi:hypothetical protein
MLAHNQVIELLVSKHYSFDKPPNQPTSVHNVNVDNKTITIVNYNQHPITKIVSKPFHGQSCVFFKILDKYEIVVTNETYLILVGSIENEYLEIFYCDYGKSKVGVSHSSPDGSCHIDGDGFLIDKDSIICPRAPPPKDKIYFNITSYQHLLNIFDQFGWSRDSYEGLNFMIPETEERFLELCELGRPVVCLKPNREIRKDENLLAIPFIYLTPCCIYIVSNQSKHKKNQ